MVACVSVVLSAGALQNLQHQVCMRDYRHIPSMCQSFGATRMLTRLRCFACRARGCATQRRSTSRARHAGRTLFDLQEVTAQIAEDTGHLPGVTIAVMGCIVNGPGEMADADFGLCGRRARQD